MKWILVLVLNFIAICSCMYLFDKYGISATQECVAIIGICWGMFYSGFVCGKLWKKKKKK